MKNSMKTNKLISVAALSVALCLTANMATAGDGHDHDKESSKVDEKKSVLVNTAKIDDGHGHGASEPGEPEAEIGVKISAEQRNNAEITAKQLFAKVMDYEIYAPAEIKANGYTSYSVSPRVDSVVLKRHVALGDHVEPGQILVTLFSDGVAQAQSQYRLQVAEWKRVKNLGRTAVGAKRYLSAQNNFLTAKSRLIAYGLTDEAIKQLASNSITTLGEYQLTARSSGVVLSDQFQQGQRVEAGFEMIRLADEAELWVEARLSGQESMSIPKGITAIVSAAGNRYKATVVQEAHTIDPVTRTRVIRLSIQNTNHRLHAGMFADAFFQFKTEKPVQAVKESALMRSGDGDWIVFVKKADGSFTSVEVELGRALGLWREIKGIQDGSEVVTQGAFFVASEQAKGGFDPHNH